jgi:predicted  nucleic acid-binding Zn-ribbon protein
MPTHWRAKTHDPSLSSITIPDQLYYPSHYPLITLITINYRMGTNDKLIQEAIAELQLLALKKPLQGYDLSKAKQLMGTLREAGYTNLEVSELTDGAWTKPTIKLYTRGVEVKDSSIKQNEVNMIAEMVRKGLSLDQVQFALSVKTGLDSKGLNFEGVSTFLEAAERAGLTLNPLILLLQDLGEVLPDPTINDLTDLIAIRDELKTQGIGLLELKNLANTSRKFGGLTGMLQAVNAYEDLESIQEEIKKSSAQKQEIAAEINSMKTDNAKLQSEKESIRISLKPYEYLRSVGFDLPIFEALAQTCKKHGDNMKQVLEAVNAYSNMTDIKLESEEFERRKQMIGIELKESEAKHAHLQTILHMSNALLYEFHYSVDAIRELHDMAKRYSEPVEVFRAVVKYGELRKIEAEIENLSNKKSELDTKIREMDTQLQSLRGQAETVKESVGGLLQPLSSEISKTVDNAFQALTSTYKDQLQIVKKESEDYGQRLGQALALQDELNLARIINSLVKYPAEAQGLNLNYALLLLDAVYKYCWVNGIDPKLTLREILSTVNTIYSDTEVHVHELVDAVKRGLLKETSRMVRRG